MTRINLGVIPSELCDQHLIAEYRELPRMVPFATERWHTYHDTGPRPSLPTLGTGHMAYFIPYGLYLQARFYKLRAEMLHRGFVPTLSWRPYPAAWASGVILPDHITPFIPLIRERICERLASMSRVRWTARARPHWSIPT